MLSTLRVAPPNPASVATANLMNTANQKLQQSVKQAKAYNSPARTLYYIGSLVLVGVVVWFVVKHVKK